RYALPIYLQVTTTCHGNFGSISVFEYFLTIPFILYFQSNFKARVTPDLFIDNSARLLCCQNKMYTKASPDTSGTDKFTDKIRLFTFQFRKFIRNKEQMWEGIFCHPFFI